MNSPPSESLLSQDQRICSSLEEKLQVYAALGALSGRTDTAAAQVEPRLLVQPNSEEPPQGAVLLSAALREGEWWYAYFHVTCFNLQDQIHMQFI